MDPEDTFKDITDNNDVKASEPEPWNLSPTVSKVLFLSERLKSFKNQMSPPSDQ